MADEKFYRFVSTYDPHQRFDEIIIPATGGGTKTIRQDADRQTPGVSLTEEEHAHTIQYVQLEEVPIADVVAEVASPNVAGMIDLGSMSFEAKKELAKQLEVPSRTGKNEEELTELLRKHINQEGEVS
jgi:hypothetical protein